MYFAVSLRISKITMVAQDKRTTLLNTPIAATDGSFSLLFQATDGTLSSRRDRRGG